MNLTRIFLLTASLVAVLAGCSGSNESQKALVPPRPPDTLLEEARSLGYTYLLWREDSKPSEVSKKPGGQISVMISVQCARVKGVESNKILISTEFITQKDGGEGNLTRTSQATTPSEAMISGPENTTIIAMLTPGSEGYNTIEEDAPAAQSERPKSYIEVNIIERATASGPVKIEGIGEITMFKEGREETDKIISNSLIIPVTLKD